MSKHILIKSTVNDVDDWHIGRFSILVAHLESLGHRVTTSPWHSQNGAELELSNLVTSDVDQLWLIAVDVVDAISDADALAIHNFRRRGGGLLVTRDHEDMGKTLLKLPEVGNSHHFQSINPEPDVTRHVRDDLETIEVSWPNYNTGANGDYQIIETSNPLHPLMQRADGSTLQFLPAHPHEGVVSLPNSLLEVGQELVFSRSQSTGHQFCAVVAIDTYQEGDGTNLGRVISESTFHHFADPNLDPAVPSPSFVTELPGDGIVQNDEARRDAFRYIENVANWL